MTVVGEVGEVGSVLLGGALALVPMSGFVLYLGTHGVDPVPNPGRPGDASTVARAGHFRRYNARYVAVTRILFRVSLGLFALGLVLLIVRLVA